MTEQQPTERGGEGHRPLGATPKHPGRALRWAEDDLRKSREVASRLRAENERLRAALSRPDHPSYDEMGQ